MQANLEIQSTTNTGKKETKNITYINPEATNSQLQNLSETLIGLTTNTYTGANRITEENVTSSGGAKLQPTLTVSNGGTVTYNGDGQLFFRADNADNYLRFKNNSISAYNSSSGITTSFSGTVYASEGDTFAAKSATFTVGG